MDHAMTDAEREYAAWAHAQEPSYQTYPLPGASQMPDRTREPTSAHEPPLQTYPLPGSGQFADRTKAGPHKFSIPPARPSSTDKINSPGTFDPKTLNRHGSCATQEPTKKLRLRVKDPNPYDTTPFNVSNLQAALNKLAPGSTTRRTIKPEGARLNELINALPKPRATRKLPSAVERSNNPFCRSSMTLAKFAEETKRKIDTCLKAFKRWDDMLPTECVTNVHKVQGRERLVMCCTTLICLAQAVSLGRPDWTLTSLPDQFFDDVMGDLEEVHELAHNLAKKPGCSWVREMAARPCYDVRVMLGKAKAEKKNGLRSSERFKEMEMRRWEETERKRIERDMKSGWQGEPRY